MEMMNATMSKISFPRRSVPRNTHEHVYTRHAGVRQGQSHLGHHSWTGLPHVLQSTRRPTRKGRAPSEEPGHADPRGTEGAVEQQGRMGSKVGHSGHWVAPVLDDSYITGIDA